MKSTFLLSFLLLLGLCSFSQEEERPAYYFDICAFDSTAFFVDSIPDVIQYRWISTNPDDEILVGNPSPLQYFVNNTTTIQTYEYVLFLNYANGSFSTDSVFVTVYPNPVGIIQSNGFSLCSGDTALLYYDAYDGIYLEVENPYNNFLDTENAPVMKFWPDSGYVYQIYFTSPAGCNSNSEPVSVSVSAAPDPFFFINPGPLCPTSEDFKLSIGAEPPGGVFSGQGVVTDTIFSPALAFAGANSITYSVIYNNCPYRFTDDIVILDLGAVEFGDIENLCLNDPRLELNTGFPEGGTYSGNGITQIDSTTFFLSASDAGVGSHTLYYTISVADLCEAVDSIVFNVRPIPAQPTVTASPATSFCDGDSITLTSSFFTNYLWSNGDTTQSTIITEPGLYNVKIRSSLGCTNQSDSLLIIVSPQIFLNIEPFIYDNSFNISAFGATDGVINGEVIGGILPYSYFLNTTSADSLPFIELAPGIYEIMVSDSVGCFARDTIELIGPDEPPVPIEPEKQPLIFPNGFTPNGDGMNDFYTIGNIIPDYTDNELMIFDVHRKLVFISRNYQNDWDGRNMDKEPLRQGTYFGVFRSAKLEKPHLFYIDLRRN